VAAPIPSADVPGPQESALSRIERGVPWSFLGVLMAVAIAIPTAYFWLHEPLVHLRYEVVRSTNVLDINERVEELAILFSGEDLYAKGLNLCVYTVRIANDGETDVLQSQFDQDEPWGLEVTRATLVRASLVGASNAYLERKAKPRVGTGGLVQLPYCHMEQGEHMDLELLLLHKRGDQPHLTPVGKVAGIGSLGPVVRRSETKRPGVLAEAFSGSTPIQVLRAAVYFVGSIVLVVLLLWLGATSAERHERRLRVRRMERLAAARSGMPEAWGAIADEIGELYMSGEGRALLALRWYLADDEAVRWAVEEARQDRQTEELLQAMEAAGTLVKRSQGAGPRGRDVWGALTSWEAERVLTALARHGAADVTDDGRVVLAPEVMRFVGSLLADRGS